MFITNKNYYFKYIQKLEDNIISKELSNKLTMPKRKRSYYEYINANKKFLLNNLDNIAKKHYYNYIITNSCSQLNESFEHSLNDIITNLIKEEEIKELIIKCILIKYEQFEKRVKDIDSKLSSYASKNKEEDDDSLLSNSSNIIFAVIFMSTDHTIIYPITCKNSDIFSKLEEKLYVEYPDLKNKNIYFISNGEIINRTVTVKKNRIKNGNTILIKEIE